MFGLFYYQLKIQNFDMKHYLFVCINHHTHLGIARYSICMHAPSQLWDFVFRMLNNLALQDFQNYSPLSFYVTWPREGGLKIVFLVSIYTIMHKYMWDSFDLNSVIYERVIFLTIDLKNLIKLNAPFAPFLDSTLYLSLLFYFVVW